MLRFICKKLSFVKSRDLPFSYGFSLSNSFLRPMLEMPSFTDPQSFTASYLQNSCGLSLNSAISVFKKLLIENPEKADSVLKLMRTHGLTQTNIQKIIGTRPTLLLADLEDKLRPNLELLQSLGFSGAGLGKLLSREPRLLSSEIVDIVEFFKAHGLNDKIITMLTKNRPTLLSDNANKILKPKLDFLKSMGFTDGAVSKLLTSQPYILGRSLENHIIPCFRLLRQVLGTNENIVKVMKADAWILEYNFEKVLVPNISMLKSHGVPEPIVLRMFIMHPTTLLLRPQKSTEILAEVVKLGLNPNTLLFLLAFRTMAVMSKTNWERKLEAYKSFGVSEDQVFSAFKKQPMCMITSEKKIKKLMDFFINKLKIEPSEILRNPNLLLLSLEKRIIPRSSVLQLLMSRGILKEDINIIYYLKMTEKKYIRIF